MLFNVAYDSPNGVRLYQKIWSSKTVAKKSLALWKERYGNNGGKPYPNGKGHYNFSNPRLVKKG